MPRERMDTLAYDKAADDIKVHQKLRAARIRPLIQNRSLWKQETEQMLPGHDGNSNIVYDEAGTLHCYDRVSQPMVRHPMAYIGHEAKRGTLKYRCPAKHENWACPMSSVCNAGKTYGLTVRIKQELDLRGAGTGIARGFGRGHAISRTAGCIGVFFPLSFGISFGVFFFRLFPSKGWSP